jgi:electron transport complex protein RnfA
MDAAVERTGTVSQRVPKAYLGSLTHIFVTAKETTWYSKHLMTEFALILVSTVLVNNFVLVKFLGLCPFLGVSRKLETATGMSLATTFVLTLSSVCSYLANEYLLAPLGLEYLRTITFILVIAVVVQFTEMVVHKTSPLLYQVLGIFLPLITTNCAVLGVALLNVQQQHSFFQSAVYGFGAALGFSMVMILFAAMRERIAVADVPEAFRGSAIALVTAGLMSLAFMGFAGLIKG